MFVDEITVEVYGGRGGNGIAVYRREKFVEYGGPWGGSGGHGGSVIFVGDEGKTTLIDLRFQRHIKAKMGINGRTKGQHGANAEHTYIKVPLGTIVYNEDKTLKIGEITEHNQELVVAKGGKGGRGNMAFATHKNPAPDYAENGDPGIHRKILVELKVLADVGLIGYPSVGKSTLISVVSNARPKIAEYPFTTLHPNLGMVQVGDESFVLADLPGLIENAHLGLGLGIQFLKHIERCRVFLHVLDLTREDPYQDYLKINHELEMYNEELLLRPQIVVANKIDMPGNEAKLAVLQEKITAPLVVISAHQRFDIDKLLKKTLEELKKAPKVIDHTPEYVKNYTFEGEEPAFIITRTDDGFELSGEKLRLVFERTDFTKDEAVKRFARQLRSMGVDDALRKEGAKHHDTIRIFDYEFEFIE
ncbi:MAG: GTPase ObgE [Tenericutes bacterium HGW-Tenericutes-2]|jgi:GTP-binding protein|nr:MAG: GTPase ObgE [Tenericutes bacterium HGW-Tenericutes-2]